MTMCIACRPCQDEDYSMRVDLVCSPSFHWSDMVVGADSDQLFFIYFTLNYDIVHFHVLLTLLRLFCLGVDIRTLPYR